MNKIKRNCMLTFLGIFIMMMTAASVNAEETSVLDRESTIVNEYDANQTNNTEPTGDEPILISPNPNEESTEDEPNLISPNTNNSEEPLISPMENQETSSEGDSIPTGLILILGISGFVAVIAGLIIFKK